MAQFQDSQKYCSGRKSTQILMLMTHFTPYSKWHLCHTNPMPFVVKKKNSTDYLKIAHVITPQT
jgi:hypothetical protein